MLKKWTKIAIEIFYVGGNLVAYYGFVHRGNFSGEAKLALTYCFALISGGISYVLVQDHRLGRKARYSEALKEIGHQHNILKELERRRLTAPEIHGVCEDMMDGLTRIFDIVTASRTAACIKLVAQKRRTDTDAPENVVRAFCRDSNSKKSRMQRDKKDHWISDNTGFQKVWSRRGQPFFCNNLPGYANYMNTSAEDAWSISPHRWFRRWPLDYRSTIIVAIASPENEERIRGFLCIDSRSRGVFEDRYDVDILTEFAKGLVTLIALHHELAHNTSVDQPLHQ